MRGGRQPASRQQVLSGVLFSGCPRAVRQPAPCSWRQQGRRRRRRGGGLVAAASGAGGRAQVELVAAGLHRGRPVGAHHPHAQVRGATRVLEGMHAAMHMHAGPSKNQMQACLHTHAPRRACARACTRTIVAPCTSALRTIMAATALLHAAGPPHALPSCALSSTRSPPLQHPFPPPFCSSKPARHPPLQESMFAEAARSKVLPPLQSFVELTSAAAPPQRGGAMQAEAAEGEVISEDQATGLVSRVCCVASQRGLCTWLRAWLCASCRLGAQLALRGAVELGPEVVGKGWRRGLSAWDGQEGLRPQQARVAPPSPARLSVAHMACPLPAHISCCRACWLAGQRPLLPARLEPSGTTLHLAPQKCVLPDAPSPGVKQPFLFAVVVALQGSLGRQLKDGAGRLADGTRWVPTAGCGAGLGWARWHGFGFINVPAGW